MLLAALADVTLELPMARGVEGEGWSLVGEICALEDLRTQQFLTLAHRVDQGYNNAINEEVGSTESVDTMAYELARMERVRPHPPSLAIGRLLVVSRVELLHPPILRKFFPC